MEKTAPHVFVAFWWFGFRANRQGRRANLVRKGRQAEGKKDPGGVNVKTLGLTSSLGKLG